MYSLKGTQLLNPQMDGTIYIYRENHNTIKLQEDPSGDTEIDLSPLFAGAEKWKWGIKTRKHYGVLLNAIAFKSPILTFNIPNILLTIKKKGSFIAINALIFAEDEGLAFKYANIFRRDNRQNIAFEFSPEYLEQDLRITPSDVIDLLENIGKKLNEIKEVAVSVKEDTTQISGDTEDIKKQLQFLINEFKNFKEEFKALSGNLMPPRQENTIIIHTIRDDGVYLEGEKIYLNLIGSVFDYLEIDIKSFISHFKVKGSLSQQQQRRLIELAKEKYFKKKKYLSPEELSEIVEVSNKEPWRISLKIKNSNLKKMVSLLSKFTGSNDIEKSLRKAIEEAVSKKQELSFELLEKYLTENEKEMIAKIKRVVQGKNKELKGDIYLKADKDMEELLLYTITIEAERKERRVIIK